MLDHGNADADAVHETHFFAEIDGQPRTFVTFDISGQTFGVEVSYVREILDHIEISRIPNIRPEIEGVIDIRSESVPIMDIGSRLGMQHLETGADTRIIIFELEISGEAQPIGILADRVRDVTQIPSAEIEAPPEAVGGVGSGNVLAGLARHSGLLIALLDIKSILGSDENMYGF